jgi:hypothetical protein
MGQGFTDPTTSPLAANNEFVYEMSRFTDSGLISPIEFGVSNLPNPPSIAPGISGYSYIVDNDEDVYLIRKAQDCGPDENRIEKVFIGKRHVLAEGSFTYYGSIVRGGSASVGAGGPWGTGGMLSPWPGPNNAWNKAQYSDLVESNFQSNNASILGYTAPTTTAGTIT